MAAGLPGMNTGLPGMNAADPNAAGFSKPGESPDGGGAATPLSALLFALQIGDSAFPAGLYTLSHGLEGLVQDGIATRANLADLAVSQLRFAVGPAEATAVALAWGAAERGDLDEAAAIDSRLHATRLPSSVRTAATRTGHQLLDLAAELVDSEQVYRWREQVRSKLTPGTHSVSLALCLHAAGLNRLEAVASEVQSFAAGYLGAALRLRIADHRSAQIILRGLVPVISEVAQEACQRELNDLGGFAAELDIASARHECAPARLFAS